MSPISVFGHLRLCVGRHSGSMDKVSSLGTLLGAASAVYRNRDLLNWEWPGLGRYTAHSRPMFRRRGIRSRMLRFRGRRRFIRRSRRRFGRRLRRVKRVRRYRRRMSKRRYIRRLRNPRGIQADVPSFFLEYVNRSSTVPLLTLPNQQFDIGNAIVSNALINTGDGGAYGLHFNGIYPLVVAHPKGTDICKDRLGCYFKVKKLMWKIQLLVRLNSSSMIPSEFLVRFRILRLRERDKMINAPAGNPSGGLDMKRADFVSDESALTLDTSPFGALVYGKWAAKPPFSEKPDAYKATSVVKQWWKRFRPATADCKYTPMLYPSITVNDTVLYTVDTMFKLHWPSDHLFNVDNEPALPAIDWTYNLFPQYYLQVDWLCPDPAKHLGGGALNQICTAQVRQVWSN